MYILIYFWKIKSIRSFFTNEIAVKSRVWTLIILENIIAQAAFGLKTQISIITIIANNKNVDFEAILLTLFDPTTDFCF